MDLVYLCRNGDDNEALRYSLRSLSNYPNHGRVWIVGYQPSWVTGVEFIPGNKSHNGHHNVYRNVLAACRHPEVPDRFAVMNDDFFITEPVDDLPVWRRGGLLQDQIDAVKGWWRQSLWITNHALRVRGIKEPLSYELHVPFVTDKAAMLEVLEKYAYVKPNNPPQWRTLYGNMTGLDAEVHEDVKANNDGPVRYPFHSTAPDTFPLFRERLHGLFPEPSPYEIVDLSIPMRKSAPVLDPLLM